MKKLKSVKTPPEESNTTLEREEVDKVIAKLKECGYGKINKTEDYIRYYKKNGDSVFIYSSFKKITTSQDTEGSRVISEIFGTPTGEERKTKEGEKNLNQWDFDSYPQKVNVVGRKPESSQKKETKQNPIWVRDEVILALELYFRDPTTHGNASHPEVIKLSQLLNTLPIHKGRDKGETFRNPNGVGMKLANFRAFDSRYGTGLSRKSKLDKQVWEDFSNDIDRLKRVASAITNNIKYISSAEELDDDVEATEGRILTRIHQKRERSAKLVKKKKQQVINTTGKLECEVCGFDYEKIYGKRGHGFAECHHTKPVCEIEEGKKTKLSDLVIVCANCHRMIHKSRPWLSANKLKTLLSTQ